MTAQSIPVPFHGHTLYIIPFNDEPYTPMRPIVEGMGLDWKSQHRKLVSAERFSVVEMTTQLPNDTQSRSVLCMPVRKLPGWLMSIHPNKVHGALRERIIAYQNECDDVLWQYWRDAHKSVTMPFHSESRPPMAQVDPVLLREYRLINPGLAQAYLVEMGVTPSHVVSLLGRVPEWLAHEAPAKPAPIEHVRAQVAAYASTETNQAWYLLPEAFERLCGQYSPRETARMLRDLGLLESDPGRLTHKAPSRLFAGRRPNVFAILKTLSSKGESQNTH